MAPELTYDEFSLDLLKNKPGLIAELETDGGQLSFHVLFPQVVVMQTEVEELAQDRIRQVVLDDLVVFVEQNHRVTRQGSLDFEELN